MERNPNVSNSGLSRHFDGSPTFHSILLFIFYVCMDLIKRPFQVLKRNIRKTIKEAKYCTNFLTWKYRLFSKLYLECWVFNDAGRDPFLLSIIHICSLEKIFRRDVHFRSPESKNVVLLNEICERASTRGLLLIEFSTLAYFGHMSGWFFQFFHN